MSSSVFSRMDWRLLIPVFVLVCISLTTLLSIHPQFFRSQLVFFILSLVLFLFFSHVDVKLLQGYGTHFYILGLILLGIILVLGIESRGAIRWIELFGVRMQFSEVLKPFFALSFASYLAERKRSFFYFIKALVFLAPVFFMIVVQPDLGNGIVYFITAFFTLLVFGFSYLWFVVAFVALALLFPFIWNFLLHDYQKNRLITFINPSNDPLGSSYNSIQSIIAIGSGMLFGKGFSEATQSGLKFLPERHTDFIFASLSEGLGFFGSSIVLIAFGFLFYRIYIIFVQSEEPFYKIFIASAFFLVLTQFFFNVGMNLGIVPVVGITLPFVSYGGSSLLSSFVFLGLLSSIQSAEKKSNILEIR